MVGGVEQALMPFRARTDRAEIAMREGAKRPRTVGACDQILTLRRPPLKATDLTGTATSFASGVDVKVGATSASSLPVAPCGESVRSRRSHVWNGAVNGKKIS